MGVPFKKIPRKDPRKADSVEKFYPQLVTLGPNADLESIAYMMKEKSSLTLGDIQSVLTNFVDAKHALRRAIGQYQEFRRIQSLSPHHGRGKGGRLHGKKH